MDHDIRNQRLTQCPQAYEFGLFHPYYEIFNLCCHFQCPQTFLQDIDSGISVPAHCHATVAFHGCFYWQVCIRAWTETCHIRYPGWLYRYRNLCLPWHAYLRIPRMRHVSFRCCRFCFYCLCNYRFR